jgi:flagellar hook-length control protein FliK
MATRDRQPHAAASQMLTPVIGQYPKRGEPTAAIATVAAQGQPPEAPADTAAPVLPEEAPTVIADLGQRLATRMRKAATDAAPAPAVLTTAATLLASHAVARRTPEAFPAPGIASEGTSPGSGGAAQPLFILPASTPGSPVAAADALAGAAPAADFGQFAIDRQLDLSSANAWLDDLARDIAAAAMKGEKLSFALSPEHLGRMDVLLSAGENGVSVGIRTETSEARAIIAQAQPRLAEELRNNGVRLADAQVDTGASHEREGGRQYHAQEQRLVEAAPWAAPEPTDEPEAAPSGRFA